MPDRHSIYKTQGHTYQADNSQPLIQAVEAGRLRFGALARGSYPGKQLPSPALPGLRTAGYWDVVEPQGWGLDWHRNEGIEITFLETGRLDFAVDQQRFALGADDLTITRPWQPHRVGNPHVSPGRLHWVILDVDVRRPNQTWKWPGWILSGVASGTR